MTIEFQDEAGEKGLRAYELVNQRSVAFEFVVAEPSTESRATAMNAAAAWATALGTLAAGYERPAFRSEDEFHLRFPSYLSGPIATPTGFGIVMRALFISPEAMRDHLHGLADALTTAGLHGVMKRLGDGDPWGRSDLAWREADDEWIEDLETPFLQLRIAPTTPLALAQEAFESWGWSASFWKPPRNRYDDVPYQGSGLDPVEATPIVAGEAIDAAVAFPPKSRLDRPRTRSYRWALDTLRDALELRGVCGSVDLTRHRPIVRRRRARQP